MSKPQEEQAPKKQYWKKWYLVTLLGTYGYSMLMAFVLVPENFSDLVSLSSEMPWYAAYSVELVSFIQTYWWAISIASGGLGVVAGIGLLPGMKQLILVNVLGLVICGCVTYAVRNAQEMLVDHVKDRLIEEGKEKLRDFLND